MHLRTLRCGHSFFKVGFLGYGMVGGVSHIFGAKCQCFLTPKLTPKVVVRTPPPVVYDCLPLVLDPSLARGLEQTHLVGWAILSPSSCTRSLLATLHKDERTNKLGPLYTVLEKMYVIVEFPAFPSPNCLRLATWCFCSCGWVGDSPRILRADRIPDSRDSPVDLSLLRKLQFSAPFPLGFPKFNAIKLRKYFFFAFWIKADISRISADHFHSFQKPFSRIA